ncbi:hypothetical protein NST86_33030 [Bacillus sp. FSL L8-0199]|nr:hypothetical protein [Bacillus thuringiensis]
MEFKKLIKYIEENKEKHFNEIIKNNENVMKVIDTKAAKKN